MSQIDMNDVKNSANAAYNDTKETMNNYADMAVNKAKNIGDYVSDMFNENPWKTVVVGALCVWALSRLLK